MNRLDLEEQISNWYEEFGNSIFTYIYFNTKDYYLAEDILQEVFIKAYKNYGEFKEKSSLKTWIFTITQNTTVDYLRKKNIFKYFKELTFNIQDTQPLPDEVVQLNENEMQLYYALQKVKLDYRQVILLRKIKGFSTKETASILGWSESKVKTNLKRGLEQLKEQLVRGGFNYEEIQRYK